MYVTASSAFAVLTALLSETPVPLHAPGPLGLIGGYPVLVSDRGVHLDLPGGCPISTAVAINKQAQVYDGIQRIDPDGRVVPSELTVETLQRELGYYCTEYQVTQCHDLAAELRARYLAYESAATNSVSA